LVKDAEKIQQQIDEAALLIQEKLGNRFDLAIILGSGLGDFVEQMLEKKVLSYAEIPYFAKSTVPGHSGTLVAGKIGAKQVLAMQGRLHYYEGHTMAEVVFPIRVMHRLGITTLIITNAAGGVSETLFSGDIMLITDHINLFGTNPLIGGNLDRWGERFPDMTDAYSPSLRQKAKDMAFRLQIPLKQGIYVGFSGPSYETPAEVRMAERIGGSAVGMSTVPEVIVARQMGMEVLGFSCITNKAAGKQADRLSHEEVLATGKRCKDVLLPLLLNIILEME